MTFARWIFDPTRVLYTDAGLPVNQYGKWIDPDTHERMEECYCWYDDDGQPVNLWGHYIDPVDGSLIDTPYFSPDDAGVFSDIQEGSNE
ncbi:MAG: hypothetical protein H6815_00355 [Phycisphaeraceae bacterium]|nr:hypothetical protein [Phycisphaerales bacterium]MCB9858875.1 hypothetical protein [Phycisphaeraceae bacterium]